MVALPGYLTQIYLSSSTSVPLTTIALTDSGDHTTFALSNTALNRYWDPAYPLTVQTSPDGTNWTSTTAYTARYCGGLITLSTALTGSAPGVQVSGRYFAVSFLGNAMSIDIKPQVDVIEQTSFTNPPSPWKTKLGGQAGSDISLSKWWVDTSFLGYFGNRLVIIAYSGANPNQRYECYAFIKDEAIKLVVNNADTDDLNFTADGQVYYYQA